MSKSSSAERQKAVKVKTVAIVGSHNSSRSKAPWLNTNIPIWVFNAAPIFEWCERATVVFELHPAGEYTEPLNQEKLYWDGFLQKQQQIPVYMQKVDPRVPMAVEYPLNEVVNKYLYNFTRGDAINTYMTSTPCYAIALALLQGYERIELYGIEMETNSEYIYQRDGVGLWLGIALGLGVEVNIVETSTMFQSPLYGYDDEHTTITREDFEANETDIKRKFAEAEQQVNFCKGQLNTIVSTMETMRKTTANEALMKKVGEDYMRMSQEFTDAVAQHAMYSGQLILVRFFMGKMDKMMEANGNALQVQALRADKVRSHGLKS